MRAHMLFAVVLIFDEFHDHGRSGNQRHGHPELSRRAGKVCKCFAAHERRAEPEFEVGADQVLKPPARSFQLGLPILIVYKVTPVNYWIARHLIDVPYVGLVNWVAGGKIIPEYIQAEALPEAIAAGSMRYLEDPGHYQHIRGELLKVRQKLGGPGASRRVAQMAREMMS